jgi:hypothetical protein
MLPSSKHRVGKAQKLGRQLPAQLAFEGVKKRHPWLKKQSRFSAFFLSSGRARMRMEVGWANLDSIL